MTKEQIIALLQDDRVQIEEVQRADWPQQGDVQLTIILTVPPALIDGYPESIDLGPDDQVYICGERIDGA